MIVAEWFKNSLEILEFNLNIGHHLGAAGGISESCMSGIMISSQTRVDVLILHFLSICQ